MALYAGLGLWSPQWHLNFHAYPAHTRYFTSSVPVPYHFIDGVSLYFKLNFLPLIFISGHTPSIAGLIASFRLSKAALSGVLRSPISFIDTTPMGKCPFWTSYTQTHCSRRTDILSPFQRSGYPRFRAIRHLHEGSYLHLSRQNISVMKAPQFTTSLSNVLGTIALIFYIFPYLGIIFVPMTILYYLVSVYYRRTSIETKRLDSLMRSSLYASYSGQHHISIPSINQRAELVIRNVDRLGDHPGVQPAGECSSLLSQRNIKGS